MATGYTATIADEHKTGNEVSFQDFTLQCARAFGATIHQRDESLNAKLRLPELSDYHKKNLRSAKSKMTRMRNKSLGDLLDAAEKQSVVTFEKQMEQYKESCEKRDALRRRYESILKQVKTWVPPTPEHQGLKDFMIEQLETSIDFDCRMYDAPTLSTPMEFISSRYERAKWDLDYHQKGWKEEQDRHADRCDWLNALGESLGVDITE